MDGIKKHGSYSSSSTFTTDLFGTKESPQPPANSSAAASGGGGAFASIFPPESTVLKKNYGSEGTRNWQKNPLCSATQAWSGGSKHRSTILEPCHLSSSIYYGGQENYSDQSSISQSAAGSSYPIYKKDGGDEDGDPNGSNSNSASRGNWWQGSLYY